MSWIEMSLWWWQQCMNLSKFSFLNKHIKKSWQSWTRSLNTRHAAPKTTGILFQNLVIWWCEQDKVVQVALSVPSGKTVCRFTLLGLFVSANHVKSMFFFACKMKWLSCLISVSCHCCAFAMHSYFRILLLLFVLILKNTFFPHF